MLWCVCVSYFSFSLFGLLMHVVSSTLSCFSYPCGLALNNWVVPRQGNKLHCRCNNLPDNVHVGVWVLCLCVVMTAITLLPGKQTHAGSGIRYVIWVCMLCGICLWDISKQTHNLFSNLTCMKPDRSFRLFLFPRQQVSSPWASLTVKIGFILQIFYLQGTYLLHC